MKRIPLIAPSFPPVDEVAADYAAIVERGIFSNGGPCEKRFAAALAAWIGNSVTVSVVSNGTAALELAVRVLLQARPARRVLVPSFTFAAGPLAIRRSGFVPLFIDIDADTWQPSIDDAKDALDAHKDVAGILLPSTFGVANRAIGDWEDLARRNALPLIIDSAAGFGSRYPWNEALGARGDCEIFSLHATKTLAVGEGGALASRDEAIVTATDRLKNFGFDDARESLALGTNAKLDELSSAIGLRQLEVLPRRLEVRQSVLAAYRSRLDAMGFQFQVGSDRSAPPFVSALLPSGALRDALSARLARASIESRTYYNPPVHRHRAFIEQANERPLPVTDDISRRIISLPMADDLDAGDLDRLALVAGVALRATH
jgi:dTDP-4-amino-4,6-dideoxygalactose transaminase